MPYGIGQGVATDGGDTAAHGACLLPTPLVVVSFAGLLLTLVACGQRQEPPGSPPWSIGTAALPLDPAQIPQDTDEVMGNAAHAPGGPVETALDTRSAEQDPPPPVRRVWGGPAADSLRAVLDSLEKRIAVAGEAELPSLLLELGRAKSVFMPARDEHHRDYAIARPAEYIYDEPGGSWGYTGQAFRDLIHRFPESELVEEAAYALTLLPLRGECEGFVPGCIAWEWESVAGFLRTHPESPLADSAVDRTLAIFGLVEDDMELRLPTDRLEPETLRGLFERLDSIGRELPPARGARLLERAGQLWLQFVEYERADSAFRAALAGADSTGRARLEAQLAALPARWFKLGPARVVHTGLVELNWRSAGGDVLAHLVHRSDSETGADTVVARLGPEATSWTDTTTQPRTTYRYQVLAETAVRMVPSNPIHATTPSTRLFIMGIAVSTADLHLHVFAFLENDFPVVLRIAPDGSVTKRLRGVFIGLDDGRPRSVYDDHLHEIWLPDRHGVGVLRFSGRLADPPPELLAAIRGGDEPLREYNRMTRGTARWTVNVEEENTAAWIHTRPGGFPTAVRCLADPPLCWAAGRDELVRQDASGTILNRVLSPHIDRHTGRFATAIHADPLDGSAWVFFGRSGHLVNVDTLGAVRHDILLAGEREVWSLALTADFNHRSIWLLRGRVPTDGTRNNRELVRIDLGDPGLPQQVVARFEMWGGYLAPDLQGGVWLVGWNHVTRVDGEGRTLFTMRLDGG